MGTISWARRRGKPLARVVIFGEEHKPYVKYIPKKHVEIIIKVLKDHNEETYSKELTRLIIETKYELAEIVRFLESKDWPPIYEGLLLAYKKIVREELKDISSLKNKKEIKKHNPDALCLEFSSDTQFLAETLLKGQCPEEPYSFHELLNVGTRGMYSSENPYAMACFENIKEKPYLLSEKVKDAVVKEPEYMCLRRLLDFIDFLDKTYFVDMTSSEKEMKHEYDFLSEKFYGRKRDDVEIEETADEIEADVDNRMEKTRKRSKRMAENIYEVCKIVSAGKKECTIAAEVGFNHAVDLMNYLKEINKNQADLRIAPKYEPGKLHIGLTEHQVLHCFKESGLNLEERLSKHIDYYLEHVVKA